MKTVQYSSQRRGTPNLHLLSHPLTLRRCNLSNESNCIVCRDAPLEFLNLPWCPSPVTGIAVVPSLTQTFPRQELQCPMTNEIRPLCVGVCAWLHTCVYVCVCACSCVVLVCECMCMHYYMCRHICVSVYWYVSFCMHVYVRVYVCTMLTLITHLTKPIFLADKAE